VKRLSPVVVYTTSRLLLFVITASVLALAGMHGVGLLLVALLVSGLLSYVLLSKQRDAMSAAVVARTDGSASTGRFRGLRGLRDRIDERAKAEDAADDAAREAQEDPPAG
jgi:hypothetical protein